MPNLKTRNFLVPHFVFVVLMMISIAGWQFASETLDSQSQSRFEQDATHLHEQIEARFNTYAQVLRGGVGLFNSSDIVTREEWHQYVSGLKLPRYFPAIRGVGFAAWVGGRENVDSFEKAIRDEGFPDYAIRPVEAREQYTAVIYLEPFTGGNRRALGYDMFTSPVRRSAMERARDTGEPALSGKLDLLKEVAGEEQTGFILYMPVYSSKTGAPLTEARRRETLFGFVMSPFRATDLMKGILRPGQSSINFQIYDGPSLSDESMLYDGASQLKIDRQSTPVQFETTKTVIIAGRLWTINYTSTPSFTKTTDSALPWILLVTGTLLSLLMSIVAWMLLSARMRVVQRTNELRKQSDINSVLLENLAEGVVACDADMTDVLMNKKAREWFQTDPSREVDMNWTNRLRMFEKDGTTPIAPGISPLFRAVAGATIQSEEICISEPGQESRFVLVTGGPLPDIDGQKSGAVLSLRDISEHRLAMKNIERQQAFLADVIDNIPNLISARDREGNHVLANKAYAESIYGMSPEELIAGCVTGAIDDSSPDVDEMQEAVAVIEKNMSLEYVRALTLLDGQQRWFSIGKLPIRSNKNSENIILTVASDITELKISEERISTMNQELESRVVARTTSLEEANRKLEEATQIAEAANLAKSSFLAVMSHEIRTPMNGVVGMVEVLMNESRNNDLLMSLQMVLDSAFSLLEIIDDILDFSKIEAGQFELENTECNITELIESVVRASVPLARKGNSTVSLYIDPEVPHSVLVDITRFRQLLTNLVGNAVKFSGKQLERSGHVEIRASVLQAESLSLQLDVIDNGVGMSQDTQEHIFDSFVQAESSITRRFGGSGLGLSICKRIVEMMHGEMVVESQLGEGSRFRVLLSLEVLSTKENAAEFENIEDVDCVLIESAEYNSADITEYLQLAGASVHEVADFSQAAATIHDTEHLAVLLCTAAHLKQSKADIDKPISSETGHVVLSREENTLGMHIRRLPTTHSGSNETISAVVVDYNALRRKSLIEAVAIAVGRASPEVMHTFAEENILPTLVPLGVNAAMAAGTCILVVEDDSVNRMVIKRQLAILGQTAEFAENGSEALEKWRAGSYGLVFTDLHMPIMDGYTMTKAIREEEPEGEHIPVVALTANALSGEPRRAAEAGVDGYLIKPLKLCALKDAVSQYLVLPIGNELELPDDLKEQSELVGNEIKVFDPEVLKQLLGDETEIIIECLQEFVVSLDGVGNTLVSSIKNQDWDSVDQLAHRLKSSSLSTGALEVWKLCKRIESARIKGELALLDSHADEMTLAIVEADTAINDFITNDASDRGPV
ncbi:CHASE domain-containing protein [Granulosicoccus antarcticus]|uniref:histidine kinase n=1 Tax=Granulosicoccus antarcticus IMCC3135 TaxID=1192854 RepID=A0A2Z2NW67_9GAMM|nr:CHASE domain-containing protein [Granulosicoccus antarcticus]ASJ75692.1 Virulence sensor protein BvgS [Granulosicoccus antarcticus IMCC3135]